MSTAVEQARATVTIDNDVVKVVAAAKGAKGDQGNAGANGVDGVDGADGADGVGPINVTGVQNALVVAEQEVLTTVGAGVVAGYTDDLREQMIGQNIDVSTGRIDYNYTEVAVGFADNARYPNEVVCLNFQLPHGWVEETELDCHLHWLQNQNAVPNWLAQYRVIPVGGAPGAWSALTPTTVANTVFAYGSGTLHQITEFFDIDMTGCQVSSIVQVKIWRDTANASGAFAGADAYTGEALALYCDCHILKDSIGSIGEYDKDGL